MDPHFNNIANYADQDALNTQPSYNFNNAAQNPATPHYNPNIGHSMTSSVNYGANYFQQPPQYPATFNVPPPNILPPSYAPPAAAVPRPLPHLGVSSTIMPPPPLPQNFLQQNVPVHVAIATPPVWHTHDASTGSNEMSEDQKWVLKWSENIKVNSVKPKPSETSLKLSDTRTLLQQAYSLMALLCTLKEEMNNLINCDDDVWMKYCNTVSTAKKQLLEITTLLGNEKLLLELAAKARKRMRKRKRLKRKRQEEREEIAKKEQTYSFISNKIDENLQEITDRAQKKSQEENMKKEADSILSEVRRKLSESTHTIQLLNALEKLRNLRKESARKRGLFTSQDSDDEFKSMIDSLKSLMEKQISNYRDEEKALNVIIESEQEIQREERRSKSQALLDNEVKEKQESIVQALFGSIGHLPFGHPLFASWSYFTQAETNLESLVFIRKNWDMYLSKSEEASGIPIPWVKPCLPSSEEWSKYLEQNF